MLTYLERSFTTDVNKLGDQTMSVSAATFEYHSNDSFNLANFC